MRRSRRAAAVVALALSLSVVNAPVSQGAVKRPDLRVSGIGEPPAQQQRGRAFRVPLVVRNTGKAKAAGSVAGVYLSTTRKKTGGSVRVGRVKFPALKPRRAVKKQATLKVPANTPLGLYFVVACSDDTKKVRESNEKNNCRSSAAQVGVVRGLSTADRIDAAVARGEIDEETGLMFKVFALAGDKRFPVKYRGDDDPRGEAEALVEAAMRIRSLSGPTQEALLPFVRPPAYPGTWEELPSASPAAGVPTDVSVPRAAARTSGTSGPDMIPSPLGQEGWFYTQHDSLPARVWFRDNLAERAVAQLAIDSLTETWSELTGLMNRQPLSDAGTHGIPLTNGGTEAWGDGGSGDLDIYITGDWLKFPAAIPYGACCPQPGFILLPPSTFFSYSQGAWSFLENKVEAILAHEFMHILQYTYERDIPPEGDEYLGMSEAIATWAIDYVYPDNDTEHMYLDDLGHYCCSTVGGDYPGWVFFLFLEHTRSSALIRTLHEAASQHPDAPIYEILDDILPGKFKERLPEYMRYAWNQEPQQPLGFPTWDGVDQAPERRLHVDHNVVELLEGRRSREYFMSGGLVGPEPGVFPNLDPFPLPPLGGHHERFSFPDRDVREIEIKNKLAGRKGYHLDIWLKLRGGGWQQHRDYSDKSSIRFCRDEASEDVVEMVVAASNADPSLDAPELDLKQNRVVGHDRCPPLRYKVLDVVYSNETTAQRPGIYCAPLTEGGTRTRSGNLGQAFFDPDNKIVRDWDKKMRGAVEAPVPSTISDSLEGCTRPPPNYQPVKCNTSLSRAPEPDGTWGIGFNVEFDDSPFADVTWWVDDPSVGFIDSNDATCNVFETWNHLPYGYTEVQEPVTKFRDTTPFTLTYSGAYTWNEDVLGMPATIDNTWSYSITLQRVDGQGNPL